MRNHSVKGSRFGSCGSHLLRELLLCLLELALQLQQRAVLELRRAVQVIVTLCRLPRTHILGELQSGAVQAAACMANRA